jgi:hypothetical protein
VQRLGSIYIRLLPSLRAAAEENYESVAILGQIDPVARAPVDDTLSNAGEPFDVGGIAKLLRNLAVTTFAAACASGLSN